MTLTAPGIKGVVTGSMDATPSATVAFQAVSAPALTIQGKMTFFNKNLQV